jgi:effector-binding domain-containing protein
MSLYFFISYPRKKKDDPNDIIFVEPENTNEKPICVYHDEPYENQLIYYKKIFKVNKSLGKGKKKNSISY